jgi:hypothetical protein
MYTTVADMNELSSNTKPLKKRLTVTFFAQVSGSRQAEFSVHLSACLPLSSPLTKTE